MSCTHAATCPLFPKLNASLRGWRDAYCDSDQGWHDCARYTRSRSGMNVPLTLLPNGKYAHTIVPPATTATSRFAAVPVARPADPDGPFEPDRHAAAATDPWSARADAAFAEVAAAQPAATTTVAPPQQPPPAGRSRWWTRLVTWLRSPA